MFATFWAFSKPCVSVCGQARTIGGESLIYQTNSVPGEIEYERCRELLCWKLGLIICLNSTDSRGEGLHLMWRPRLSLVKHANSTKRYRVSVDYRTCKKPEQKPYSGCR